MKIHVSKSHLESKHANTSFTVLYNLHSLNVKVNWNKGQFLVISKSGRLETCSCNGGSTIHKHH